jgi:hypothetical protein
MITETTDRKEALEKCLEMLGEVFARDLTETLVLGYFFALRDLSVEQIRTATDRALQESKGFPTPASLIELSGYATVPRRALIAWQDAVNAVSRYGYPCHVSFDDWIINAVIRGLGGWITFNSLFTNARDEDFLRLKFIKAYEYLSGFLDANSPQCDYLPGLNTVEPPVIRKVASSIPVGSLTHTNGASLPRPPKDSVGKLQGMN